jgi:hypothetical protein
MDRKIEFLDHLRTLKPNFDPKMDRKIEFLDHLRTLKPIFDPKMDRKNEFLNHFEACLLNKDQGREEKEARCAA